MAELELIVKECGNAPKLVSRRLFLHTLGLTLLSFANCAGMQKKADYSSLDYYTRLHARFESIYSWDSDLIRRMREGYRVEGDPTNSLDTIAKLPFDKISDMLGLNNRADVQILYPGAGTHLAVLEIGRKLQQKLPNLQKVNYIFTEMGSETKGFEEYLELTKPDLEITGKEKFKYDQGEEILYELRAFGRDMNLTYAINRSVPKSDHTHFKRQYLIDSDIMIYHDSFDPLEFIQLPLAISIAGIWGIKGSGQKAIIFEDMARVFDGKNDKNVYSKLPGEVVLVEGAYGCPVRNYKGAVVYFPDNKALSRLEEKGKLEDIFDILNGLYFEREKKIIEEEKHPTCSIPGRW